MMNESHTTGPVALTDEQMNEIVGGDNCSDMEKAMMVLGILGQAEAVAFIAGAYLVLC